MPAPTAVLQLAMAKTGRMAMGFYIPNAAITALTSSSFTAPRFFLNGMFSNNTYQGWGVWRPSAASAADYFRHISSIAPSTGVVTVDASWADTTSTSEDIYILPPGISPDMIVDCLSNSLRYGYFPNLEPVSMKPVGTGIADAGMQNTATSAYSTYGTVTFTKHGTANSENVFRGINAGKIVTTAVTSGVYQQYAIGEGERVIVHNLSMLSAGTSSQLELYDGSNVIGTTSEHSQRKWMYMRRRETMTDGKTTLTVRQLGEGSSDTVYLNGVFVVTEGTRQMILDTRWDTAYKAEMGLKYVQFRGQDQDGDVFDAFGAEMIDVPRHLYDIDIETPGANPTRLQFHDGIEEYLRYPIYIHGRRAFSDLYSVTIADVATSVPINTDLWDALFRLEYFSKGDVRSVYSDWALDLGRAQGDAAAASARQIVRGPSRKHTYSSWGRV